MQGGTERPAYAKCGINNATICVKAPLVVSSVVTLGISCEIAKEQERIW